MSRNYEKCRYIYNSASDADADADEEDSGVSSMSSYRSASAPWHGSRTASSTLDPEIKQRLLSVKKIPEPFNPGVQRAFEAFVDHIEDAGEEFDLPEEALLLQGATKIYTAQVDTVVQDVQNLLEAVKNTKKASLERKKAKADENKEKKKEGEKSGGGDGDETMMDTEELTKDKDDSVTGQEVSELGAEIDQSQSQSQSEPPTEGNSRGNPEDDVPDSEFSVPDAIVVEKPPPEVITLFDDPPLSPVPPPPAADADAQAPAAESTNPEENPLKRSHDEQDQIDGEPLAKKKRPLNPNPPELISCFEELEELKSSGFFNLEDHDLEDDEPLPPTLEKMPKISLKNLLCNEEGLLLPKEKKERVPRKKEDVPVPPKEANPDASDNANTKENENNQLGSPEKPPEIETESEPFIPVPIKLEPPDPDDPAGSGAPELDESSLIPPAAANFSPEDQSAIQECINELHYLPFTFGLSKSDLANAFSKTVERMSKIFKKNNVQVTRNVVKKVAPVERSDGSTESSASGGGGGGGKPEGLNGLHPFTPHNLGDMYNTLVKSCREECESFINNTTTIMERTKEKSFSESRANIRAMITELQRNIVPKFARVPLMAENTPEFFQHVTNFEKKMQKILEEEAKKGEFDVRKYEKEVLEVTAKESSELDRSFEDFLIPGSPGKSRSIDSDIFIEPLSPTRSIRSSFDCSSQSSCGNSWVPIKHIFENMKSLDRTEAARSFYAVLALLSYQNLDINYDQLYSQESAKLIQKHLGVGDISSFNNIEEDLDSSQSKFHRGVKIMTSRCPDVDKEEVFVAALTSESRDESFRHLLAQEAANIARRDMGAGPSTSASASSSAAALRPLDDEGIAEALAAFVEEKSSIFTGSLHSKRARKKHKHLDTS